MPGPTIVAPRRRSVSTFSTVAGLAHMSASIAGPMTSGVAASPLVGRANTVLVSRLSAIPWAILAMVLAVAGAMTSTSARAASEMWAMSVSRKSWNISTDTGRLVMVWKGRGVTKRVAPSVMMTSTVASACTSLLARSTAL